MALDKSNKDKSNKKLEKGQATRHEIVRIATRLFTKRGYGKTSIDLILRQCKMSRGALYYHFPGKELLFEAVFQTLEESIVKSSRESSRGVSDPVEALRLGCNAFLDLAQQDSIRQIVLRDAPAVLGWQKWREIDARYGFGLLKASLAAASAAGYLQKEMVETFSHILLAALMEVALMIARADDAATATRSGQAAIQQLLGCVLCNAQ